VFTSTIGELNAIEPLLTQLLERLQFLSLTLLSDHAQYRDSFLAKYPAAQFHIVDHRTSRVESLMVESPPALLILAEIPGLLSDAPCRLPFSLVLGARKRGARVCLINGWLYKQRPASRMDTIEKYLFERDYLCLFDVMTVQNDEIRRVLIEAGAPSDRVFVTGNIKFDALANATWDPADAKSSHLLLSIVQSGRPILTAGCVTNIPEQELMLDAFRAATALPSNPLLVLVPRHPENRERMSILARLLSERGYRFVFKTSLAVPRIEDTVQCLVVDTLGELKDFYAASTFSYVGLNHNVLEPLAFGKKVLVTPGWDPIHPSFAVYRMLVGAGFITEVQHPELSTSLVAHFEDTNTGPGVPHFRRSAEYLELIGATDRCMACLEPILTAINA
jgi:3-deoxy-D-manno-octulosonic-acid transferase